MKPLLLTLGVLLPLSTLSMADDKTAPLNVTIDTPTPAWALKVLSIHQKDKTLIVICEATSREGIFPSVMATASATAKIPNELAELKREIYVLGQSWNYNKGYTPITADRIPTLTKDSTEIWAAPKKWSADDLIGLSPEDAIALAKKHKTPARVVEIDGKPQPVTLDIRPGRLNLSVTNNKVTKVAIEGQPAAPKKWSANDLIGLSPEDAIALAKKHKTPARVVEIDGKPQPVTLDIRPGRLNLSVTDNKVTKVAIEGQPAAPKKWSANDLIGLSPEDAIALAKKHKTPARVVEIDGKPQPVTLDIRPGRLNLSVTDNKVTKVAIEGQPNAPKKWSADDLIGLSPEDAIALAKKHKTPARVVETDGKPQPVTLDIRPGRLNLSVTNNKVTKVAIEGQPAAPKKWSAYDLIGLSPEDAIALAKKHKTPARVVEIDGAPQVVTEDFRPGRLNLSVTNNKVTKVKAE
ncbi:hypothetical protein [Rubritalea tangerina]|uniref:Uncharacterized protein n=1 Tax=Rubritalea tangerina TaxID=430798 RepID=A0ABW4Z7L2_9BACT